MNTFATPEPLLKYLTGLSLAPGKARLDLLVTLLDADVRCCPFGIPQRSQQGRRDDSV